MYIFIMYIYLYISHLITHIGVCPCIEVICMFNCLIVAYKLSAMIWCVHMNKLHVDRYL